MRVLFVIPTLDAAGAEKLTVGYARGLQERGHETAVAYGLPRHPLRGELEEAGVRAINVSPNALSGRTLLEWARSLRRTVREFRPDVIHAQSVTSALAARLATPRTPLLVTLHGISMSDEPLAALIFRAVRAHLTAVSAATAKGITRFRWAPHVDVLPPGVDLETLRTESLSAPSLGLVGEPRLCCVARQEPQKGIDILLRSFVDVRKRLPGAGLTLVGGGDELETYTALAEEIGLAASVRFVGAVPNAAPYIARADVMILPSRWEGLPVVALESLGLERPLVATAVSGTPSVVIDGQTGWLVPPENEQALASAIVDCIERPDEARRRAESGRELIEARFSSKGMLDRLEELLLSLTR